MQFNGRLKPGARRYKFALVCLLISALLSVSLLPATAAASDISGKRGRDEGFVALDKDFSPRRADSVNAAAIYEIGFEKNLHRDHNDLPMVLSASNKAMILLLALEHLGEQEQVTISESAAYYSDDSENTAAPRELAFGDTYPADFLMYMVSYYQSDLAAVALAEAMFETTGQAVTAMNDKANELDLKRTKFTNITGTAVLMDGRKYDESFDYEHDFSLLQQYSTLDDFAVIIRRILRYDRGGLLFERERFYIMPDKSTVIFRSPVSRLWTDDSKVMYAWNVRQQNHSTSFLIGKQNDMNYFVVLSGITQTTYSRQLINLLEDCLNYYEVTPLVTRGQSYSGIEHSKEGDRFGLQFLNTIYYVHPQSDDFLYPTVSYSSNGEIARPITRDMAVGTVTFTQKDGARISADVGPDRQILSDNSIIAVGLESLHQNPNLANLIFILSAVFLLLFLYKNLLLLRRVIREWRLSRLNRRSDED